MTGVSGQVSETVPIAERNARRLRFVKIVITRMKMLCTEKSYFAQNFTRGSSRTTSALGEIER